MVDMYLLGLCDVILLLFQSKFGNAAMMRSINIGHGIRETLVNTRITHSLVDGLVGRMQHGGAAASPEQKATYQRLWDLFGPVGSRDKVETARGSSYVSSLDRNRNRPRRVFFFPLAQRLISPVFCFKAASSLQYNSYH